LDGILRSRACHSPDRPAYVFLADGETEADSLTWSELDCRARAVAAALRRECVPGDRALLLYPPSLDFIVAFFGCLYAHVVAVPAYPPRPRRDQPRLRAIVEDARPRVALTTPALLAGAGEIQAREPSLVALRWLATAREDAEPEPPNLPDPPEAGPEESPQPGEPAFLQYTSGSTALPKGVVVSHANLLHNERLIQQAFGTSESSVVVGWLPLYHDMGLIGNVLQPLYCGGRCVLMSPAAFLQRPRRWLEAITRYRGTTSGGPNFAYELCVQKIAPRDREGLDLASWSVAYNGAEPVRADTLERFAAAFAPSGFSRAASFPCYGLAEATLFVTGGSPGAGARTATVSGEALARHEVLPATAGDASALRLVSSGRAAAEQQVLIVDPESRIECPPGRVGEIWVSGPSVARDYWGRPEVSAAELRAPLADGSGSFLRTGDLGFRQDGELYVTGRRKDLIILRGRNHYPQDLELTAERAQAALRPGCGAAFAVEAGDEERLVLVFEVDRHALAELPVDEVAAAVRQALAEEHEVQLSDLVLIRQGTLPKTSSGKVQRHACRVLYLNGGLTVAGRSALGEAQGEAPAAEPRSEPAIEDVLQAELARVVRIDPARIDRGRAMSSYGLDSLGAVELRNAVEERLGAAPSIAELLEGISITAAAGQMAVSAAAARSLPPSGAPDDLSAYPLSLGQQALWILYGLEPASAAYNIAGAARLAGGFDTEVLSRSFQALASRHPALRTTFADGPDGPVQRVHAESPAAFVREDAAEWSEEELRRRVRDTAFRPFDLEKGPVLRAALFDRGAGDPRGSVLVLAVHHLAADFWSLAVLVRELGDLYARGGDGGGDLPAPAVPYVEVVRRQRREQAAGRYDGMLAEARRQLAGAPPLDLPWDRPRPALQTFGGMLRGGRLGRELAEAVRALARRHGATLFMTLLAGFEALLARYGGQEDFLVGTPTSGRSSRDLEGLVGYLVNPVPLRAELAGDPDTRTLLLRARGAALAALARQDLPFSLLAEGLAQERDPSRPAVVQAMLVLQRAPAPELEALTAFALGEGGARLRAGGLILESVALEPPSAQFDATLLAGELEGDLAAGLQLNDALFDATTAQRMLGHFAALLAAMTRGEDRRLLDLAMLTDAEAQQVLGEWNATAAASPAACLHELIEEQVESTPQAPAVVCAEESLTYRELNARANQLARQLERMGVGPEVRVGICAERSTELIVGLLATLKAGAAYVPIDPSYPAERLAWMLEDARVPVLLTQERLASVLPAHAARSVYLEQAVEKALDGVDPGNPRRRARPDNLAYVLYTSGSTGRPKGAMNSHRAIVNRIRWMQRTFRLTAADRVLQKTPASFDVSVWEFFWPLTAGACLVVARPGGHLDPPYLRDEIAARGVTTLHFVPSLLQVFLDQQGLASCAGLRRVIASGEALTPEAVSRFHARLAGVELHNLYGPTEAAVDVTWWPCPANGDARSVPIGRPIDNTRIYLLDRSLRPVPLGVAGELAIGGVQVGRGYLGRPDLTAARFIPDPFVAEGGGRLYRTGDLVRHRPGGELEFLGRIDHQVKVRGIRIELAEIELALAAHGAVREAVVAVRGEAGQARLVAYVVPAGDTAPDTAALRAHLQTRLPEALIPAVWMFLPRLPLSPSGKVDRKALPEPELAAADTPFAAPVTAAEETLAAIWSAVLRRDNIGVHDNFFALGGDSILGMQILSRAAQAGLRVTPRQIFRYPTLAELAAVAERIEGGAVEQGPVAGEVPLTPIQRWFFERELPSPQHWNWPLATFLTVAEPPVPGLLEEALARLALHHDALRLRFFSGPEGWRGRYAGGEEGVPCLRIDLSALAEDVRPAAMALAAAASQASLDLGRGPLLRAVLFAGDAGRPARLLLVVHHLVVDGVSWRIVLEDFDTVYGQLLARRAVRLPARTSSYQAWARRLEAHARSARLAGEVSYWLAQGAAQGAEAAGQPGSAPGREAANVEASGRTVRAALPAPDTEALLHHAHDAYQTSVDDLLRTALVRTFGRATGRRSLLVDLEGHGREDLFPDLDLSRTVGWFTSLYRVRLDLGGAAGTGEELRAIKEQGRRIPAGGVGYGLLRYAAGDPETAARLREPRAEVLFNYLGQLGALGAGAGLFEPVAEPVPATLDPGGRRSHRWIINCWIAAGRLETEWSYSQNLEESAEVQRLADAFVAELRALIDHCLKPGAGAYSASDFPEAELSEKELRKLMSKLGRNGRGAVR
jgi:amino acid adenylation domain-containing protein/non-ribosomal peptide synthase protein (TIGR01720 family)